MYDNRHIKIYKGISMKKTIMTISFSLIIGAIVSGCTGTVKGVKQDAGNAYDATKATAQEIVK
jgi:predicted small secreted protein